MKKISFLICSFFCVTLCSQIKVNTFQDGVLEGVRVEPSPAGIKLFLKEGDKSSRNISLSNIKYIESPQPKMVNFLNKAFVQGKYKQLASLKGERILQTNRFNGWGKKSAFPVIFAKLKTGQMSEARDLLKKAKSYISGKHDKEDRLFLGMAEQLIKSSSGEPVSLGKIPVPNSRLGKTFYYYLQGVSLEEKSKNSEALLSYYKAVFLGDKIFEVKEIQKRIEGIYKSQGDPRVLPDLTKL